MNHAIVRTIVYSADGRKEGEIVEHYLTCTVCQMEKMERERPRQYKTGVCSLPSSSLDSVFAPNCSEGAPVG